MRRITTLILLGMLAAGGCTGDKGKELFETARYEEQQHNREHAVQLYREILTKYPGTDYAEKAGKRLTEIGPAK
jgi:TolA-binding protein